MKAVSEPLKFMPFDKQFDPLLSTAPITACVTGARGGKTKCGAFLAANESYEQNCYDQRDIESGVPYVMAVGAPTFPVLQRVVLPAVLNSIPDHLKLGRYHETKKIQKVYGCHGITHIYFISAKLVESWYGLKLGWVWLDEFAQVKEVIFDELQTRLSDSAGRMFLTGTPQGPNWAHKRLFIPWKNGDRKDIAFYTWTTMDNPYMVNTEAKRVAMVEKQRTMPKRYFDRTFLASWDTFEGQVYEEWMEALHCRPRENYKFRLPSGFFHGSGQQPVHLNFVVAGVDWGWAPGHAGVIIVGGKDSQGRWWLLEESVAEGVLVTAEPTVDSWVTRAMALRAKWGISKFYCDSENPQAIECLRRIGLPAVGANKSVKPGIECVAKFLHMEDSDLEQYRKEPLLICLSDLRNTIDELNYYHWKEGKEEPEKVNDNCCDSVRYMIYSHETRGKFRHEPTYSA